MCKPTTALHKPVFKASAGALLLPQQPHRVTTTTAGVPASDLSPLRSTTGPGKEILSPTRTGTTARCDDKITLSTAATSPSTCRRPGVGTRAPVGNTDTAAEASEHSSSSTSTTRDGEFHKLEAALRDSLLRLSLLESRDLDETCVVGGAKSTFSSARPPSPVCRLRMRSSRFEDSDFGSFAAAAAATKYRHSYRGDSDDDDAGRKKRSKMSAPSSTNEGDSLQSLLFSRGCKPAFSCFETPAIASFLVDTPTTPPPGLVHQEVIDAPVPAHLLIPMF